MAEKESRWVVQTAEHLGCELLDQMANIRARCRGQGRQAPAEMDAVCGHVSGDWRMEVRFRAEPRMFYRLACNQLGGEPENEEVVRECATEFFNVLCGRFISEICNRTRTTARFCPPEYEEAAHQELLTPDMLQTTVFFETEKQEIAEFAWSKQTMDQLLERSGIS